jgi:hypothetical protein
MRRVDDRDALFFRWSRAKREAEPDREKNRKHESPENCFRLANEFAKAN